MVTTVLCIDNHHVRTSDCHFLTVGTSQIFLAMVFGWKHVVTSHGRVHGMLFQSSPSRTRDLSEQRTAKLIS